MSTTSDHEFQDIEKMYDAIDEVGDFNTVVREECKKNC